MRCWEAKKASQRGSSDRGGTFNATAFKDKNRADGKTEVLFNGPGDGSQHGHHVTNSDGSIEYVRDVEGEVYVDRSKE